MCVCISVTINEWWKDDAYTDRDIKAQKFCIEMHTLKSVAFSAVHRAVIHLLQTLPFPTSYSFILFQTLKSDIPKSDDS